MGGGTEAFPDLGEHCQHPDCRRLDFLPFNCHACHSVYCLEHRSCKAHNCPKSNHDNRKVVVCEACSASIETTGQDEEDEKTILERHEKSGDCDPWKKKKPVCPVRRCRQVLTFSNTSTCKTCQLKVCLRHRFPADHLCKGSVAATRPGAGAAGIRTRNEKFLAALDARSGTKDCGKEKGSISPKSTPYIRAY